ncbi:transglutaminase family protein [Granulosicoccaceae sp. 1_MG-2023]|nr:transglutaminase family protein [Granulosicoccaceae sp. 1_MG-2023]
MRFTIKHHTRYAYNVPAILSPHDLRFYPRDDGCQRLLQHSLTVSPTPVGQTELIDAEGNRVLRVWFDQPADELAVTVEMVVETHRPNPYEFILEPQALSLPLDYGSEAALLSPYLARVGADPDVDAVAARLAAEAGDEPLRFLHLLNDFLYTGFQHQRRETGAPLPPGETLRRRHGPCRDMALLFMDCCRAQGIAARFASGYRHAQMPQEQHDLHAWPEVYLPGAGWRGFDPGHGEFIAGTHVTVASSATPAMTMPISGFYSGAGVSATLEYQLNVTSS